MLVCSKKYEVFLFGASSIENPDSIHFFFQCILAIHHLHSIALLYLLTSAPPHGYPPPPYGHFPPHNPPGVVPPPHPKPVPMPVPVHLPSI